MCLEKEKEREREYLYKREKNTPKNQSLKKKKIRKSKYHSELPLKNTDYF